MQRGVHIGTSHRFDERRDHIVVIVTVPVIPHSRHVHHGGDHVCGDFGRNIRSRFVNCTCCGLKYGQRFPGISARQTNDPIHGIALHAHLAAQASRVRHRPFDHGPKLFRFQRFELDHDGTAQQRFDHREARVLRGRRDEGHVTVFHAGQQCILLRFGEAVHLVDEQNGLFALTHQSLMGTAQHLAKILDAGRDGGELLVLPAGLLRDYMGQCSLAHTRWPE